MNLNAILTRLAEDPAAPFDVAEVALLLARDEYPDLDVDGYLAELTAMAREVRRSLRGGFAARVEGLCRYLYHDLGFRGNSAEYYDPRNSYFNQVLDRRTGIPITLSAVAMAIGQRAGLNVVGVALPGHFIAKAVAGGRAIFFDPFHGGRRLTVAQCEELVRQVTGLEFEASPETLRAAPLGPIVVRMLNNLKAIYLRDGDFARAVKVLKRLRQLQPEDVYQQRDLGVALLHAGRAGQAIDHLKTFLETSDDEEAEPVRKLLARAQGEVARWN